MSIIYSLIARNDTRFDRDLEYGLNFHVLVELTEDFTGNFPLVTRELILKNPPKEQKVILNYQSKYIFHILNDQDLIYICMTDEKYSRRRGQTFLKDVRDVFCEKYAKEQRDKAISFSLNDSFSPTLREKMKYYNENALDPKMAKLKSDMGETLKLYEQNIEALNERGEKITMIVQKAQTLNFETNNLKVRSGRLKDKARNEKMQKYCIFGGGAAAILFLIFLI